MAQLEKFLREKIKKQEEKERKKSFSVKVSQKKFRLFLFNLIKEIFLGHFLVQK